MKLSHYPTIFPILVLALLPASLLAAEQIIKGITYHQDIALNSVEIGDVEGHHFGMGESKGVAIHEDGTKAATHVRAHVDFVGSAGVYQGYETRIYPDGSKLVLKFSGNFNNEEGKRVSTGPFLSCHGTGQFAGMTCSGSFEAHEKIGKMRVSGWELKLTSTQ